MYFNLVNLYGAVPLITGTDYNVNRLVGRSPTDSVYSFMIGDLQDAQAKLPQNVSSFDRVTYYAATALLAKVYLFKGNYPAAESEASKVISSGKFNIMSDLNSVFLSTSTEAILKLVPVAPGKETTEGGLFVVSSTTVKPKYVLNNNLFNSFETADKRKSNWVNINTVAGQQYPYPYKYKKATTTGTPTENYVLSRLAEQYLIRSEARANMGDIPGSTSDLNVIRNRAGLPNTTANDKPTLLTAIEKERQSELFCELGNRWFDLKRNNSATSILGPLKAMWNPTAILYPIPAVEIKANPNLVQNQGY